jgi:cell division septum initiation protein DivIVA
MTLSPEEIRHLSISRSVRGYDRRETDRLLAAIADSFESVWHQRTELYAEVKRLQADVQDARRLEQVHEEEIANLQKRLKHGEATIANLREEAARLKADREALLAERKRATAEHDELRNSLLEEAQQQVAREKALMATKHKKLSEFLLAALEEVERAATNGSTDARDVAELEVFRNAWTGTE